jgi:hypothetical protein
LLNLFILDDPLFDCFFYCSEEVGLTIESNARVANSKPNEVVKKIARAVVLVVHRPMEHREKMQLNRYLNSFNPFTDKTCKGYKAHQTLMQKFAIDLNHEVLVFIASQLY